MADQQSPSKRPCSESPLLPSPLKVRRLDNTPAESAPVSPPDSTKNVKSDSSPPDPKQQQPKSVSNSSPKCPVVARPVDYTGMSLEERLKFRVDPVYAAEEYQAQNERWQRMEERRSKMSRAEQEQWIIDLRRKNRKSFRISSRSLQS
jgi:hypothetical protein